MKDTLKEYFERSQLEKRKRHKITFAVLALSLAVVAVVVWQLRLPGATLADDVKCGYEEHIHGDSCIERTLKCELAEHSHIDACYEVQRILNCAQEHEHTEQCYKEEKILKCELAEHTHTESCYESVYICGKAEHTHTLHCYSAVNTNAETKEMWEATLPAKHELTHDMRTDLVLVAKSQLGYQADASNYKINENGISEYYSRYGAWYGNPYGNWNTVFVSFCLNYAGIPESVMPFSENCAIWTSQLKDLNLYTTDSDYIPRAGDIAFFDKDGDSVADYAGIVTEVNGNRIKTIEAITNDKVTETGYEDMHYADIIGFGYLPAQYQYSPDNANGLVDFTDFITGVSLEQRKNQWSNWENVTDGKISSDSQLRFDINYTIPGGVLDNDNKTILYHFPNNLAIRKTDSGKVYNKNGQEVGTYVISEDGTVAITFTDDCITKNDNGQAIVGNISFTANADDIKTDDSGNTDIKFSDKVSLDIHIENKVIKSEDLTVEKQAINIDGKNGKVTYQIKVTSENGTADVVTLDDIMYDLVTDGDIKVIGAGDDYTVNKEDSKFTVILPKMNAGDVYIIEYTAKLKKPYNGTKSVENDVTVNSTNSEGAKLRDTAEVKTELKCDYVSKKGELSSDGEKIKWTVTVNGGKTDIGGWTLDDKLNGNPINMSVNISPAVDGKSTITLPYTFPQGTQETYTVTYETALDVEIGKWGTVNVAQLIKDGNTLESGTTVGNNGQYNPIHKHSTGIDENNNDDSIIEIKWIVNIKADQGTIPADWVYTDKLQDKQWFTGKQLKALKFALDETLSDEGLNLNYTMKANLLKGTDEMGDEVEYDQIADDAKYKAYKFIFSTPLEKGYSFTYTYRSSAPIEDGTTSKIFRNSADINEKTYASGEFTYKNDEPTVIKVDKKANGDRTSHGYYDNGEQGIMEWEIMVIMPENYNDGAITVKEYLPDGVDLKKFEIKADGIFDWNDITASNIYNIDGKYDISKSQNGQDITVIIPENLAHNENLKQVTFSITVKISDDFAWPENKTNDFVNEVEIVDAEGEIIAGDVQSQKITKTKQLIGKSYAGTADNIIPYTLVINKDGEDLVKDSDTLIIKDVLKYSHDPNKTFRVNLVPGSLKAYCRNADGTKGKQLDNDKISYVYSEGDDGSPHWITKWRNLSIKVPDSMPLILEYSYQVGGNIGDSVGISNSAEIDGVNDRTEEERKSDNYLWFTIQKSSATANMDGVTIYKVDSDNNAILLKDAEFELYRWDGIDSEYKIVADKNGVTALKTDSDGMVLLTELAFNTAYRLKEIKAPQGYLCSQNEYMFFIINSDTASYPECKPQGFTGEGRADGDIIYYPNKRDATSITVQKMWQASDGSALENTPNEIEIEIWQKTDKSDDEGILYKTCKLTAPNWSLDEKLLPKTAYDENNNILGNYVYYVKEKADMSKYEVTYENNGGISEGTVTITNKEKRMYILPESGGIGTRLYVFAGVLTVFAALSAAFILHIHNKKINKI